MSFPFRAGVSFRTLQDSRLEICASRKHQSQRFSHSAIGFFSPFSGTSSVVPFSTSLARHFEVSPLRVRIYPCSFPLTVIFLAQRLFFRLLASEAQASPPIARGKRSADASRAPYSMLHETSVCQQAVASFVASALRRVA